jgi:dolichol-phosphate mannosyltransferase
LNRDVATALVPLIDVALFCVLIAAGMSLRSSHITAFAAAMALNYLLKVRSTVVAAKRTRDIGLHARLLVVAVMALFLRGGVLSLLSLNWGWPPQVSIVFAVLAGWAVTAAGFSHALSSAKGEARWRALAIGVVVYAFVLRLVYLGSIELLPEEAYYWEYSRHLDIGYLDHPPMVAWLIKLGTAVFGQSQFGVRVGALACSVFTSVFTYRLARNLYGEASALAALVLSQALPFFFLTGLLMTPDAPLTAAWAASLFYLERALVENRSSAWWRLGFWLGVGIISKYTIALLVPAALVFMLRDRQSRRWLRRFEPYAAALLAVAIFSPVIIWNAHHDWASFVFQTSRRLAEAPKFALHRLIAAALILITPTGVLAIAVGLAFARATPAERGAGTGGDTDAGTAADDARRRTFIGTAVLVPVAVFALFSLRHEVKLDWTGAPWVAALPIMAAGMIPSVDGVAGIRASIRNAWVPTLVTLLLIYGAFLHYLVLGLPAVGYGKHIELVPVGWREISRRIDQTAADFRKETGGEPLIVGMDRYAIASELAFYGAAGTIPMETSSVHLFDGVGLMFALWTPAKLEEGRTLVLVAWDPRDLDNSHVESHAERLGPIEDEVLLKDGHVVRHYYHRFAYNYRSIPVGDMQ